MIAISFRFPAGRYHATPWGSHVNEGRVEWPPSPWRIARALVSVWHKLAEPPDEAAMRRVVVALASTPPRYRLPRASTAHTRHYMPIPGNTTKVLDAFVSTARRGAVDGGDEGALVVGWDLDLTADEHAALMKLLDGLGYLGRAEAWVEAALTEPPPGWDMLPDGAAAGDDVFLWTVMSAPQWAGWREGFLAGVTSKKKPALPATVFDVLVQDTAALQKAGWSTPPGTCPVRYAVPRDAVRVSPVWTDAPPTRADVAWLRISGPVMPPVAYTTWIAERVRVSAMSLSRDDDGAPSPVFSGHEATGAPASGQQHAWFLPYDQDDDGLIDHVAVWAPAGLGPREREALARLTGLWGDDGHTLDAVLLAFTCAADHPPLQGTATVWRSATPFICPRHAKKRATGWKDSVVEQAQRAWRQLWEHRQAWPGATGPAEAPGLTVEVVSREGPALRAWNQTRIDRPRRGVFGVVPRRFDLRLTFDQPVSGPLCLGAGAHFGLGRFIPE